MENELSKLVDTMNGVTLEMLEQSATYVVVEGVLLVALAILVFIMWLVTMIYIKGETQDDLEGRCLGYVFSTFIAIIIFTASLWFGVVNLVAPFEVALRRLIG